MNGQERGDRHVALFLLGVLLFSPPLLAIFRSVDSLLGIPILYVYVFGAWAALILLVARFGRAEDDGAPEGPREQRGAGTRAADGLQRPRGG
jgi:hypothetical protein